MEGFFYWKRGTRKKEQIEVKTTVGRVRRKSTFEGNSQQPGYLRWVWYRRPRWQRRRLKGRKSHFAQEIKESRIEFGKKV